METSFLSAEAGAANNAARNIIDAAAKEWWGSAARAEAVLSSSSEELLELADELGQPTFAEFGKAKRAARAAVLAELRRRAAR